MSDLLTQLLSLERQGTQALTSGGAASFYGALLTDDALMVVPGFIVDKPMFVQMVDSEASCTSFAVEEPRVISLTADAAILVYRARGQRTGQPDYVALMSSVYVKHDGQWRLAHHQQHHHPDLAYARKEAARRPQTRPLSLYLGQHQTPCASAAP